MDTPALPMIPSAQSEESWTALSVLGLKLAIELGKDCLLGQLQQKQATEQRAFQLIPFSVGLAGILITLTYTGKLPLIGGTIIYYVATATVLAAGISCCIAALNSNNWGYIGIEPKEAVYQYTAGGGEQGLLKAISDDYQQKIERNKKELSRMFIFTRFAIFFALVAPVYGILSLATNPPQHEAAPPSVTPLSH